MGQCRYQFVCQDEKSRYAVDKKGERHGAKAFMVPFIILVGSVHIGLPRWLSWRSIHLQCGRPGFDPWVGKICWRRERLPTPVFWPGEFHGPYSPWGCKESDTTERLSLSLCFHFQMASNIDCARTCLWIFLKSVTSLLLPPVQK